MTPARNEPAVTLRRLLPEPAELTADEAMQQWRPWESAPPGRPCVALNMVHTTDGRAALQGKSGAMSSVADRQLFHAMRTRVDAVMIGAGTARIERYGRIVPDPARREQRSAAGLQPDPLAVIVSGSLHLPSDLPLLQDPDSRVVILTSDRSSLAGVRAEVEYLRFERVDLAAALSHVRDAYGVRAILCEGGPRLNASLLTAGVVDELFLSTAPMLAGSAGERSIVEGAALRAPHRLRLRWLLEHEGALFARYGVGQQ